MNKTSGELVRETLKEDMKSKARRDTDCTAKVYLCCTDDVKDRCTPNNSSVALNLGACDGPVVSMTMSAQFGALPTPSRRP